MSSAKSTVFSFVAALVLGCCVTLAVPHNPLAKLNV